jgi:hypothetical protein
MSHATSVISNSRESLLLGTSALVCLALATPAMAEDFTITSGSTKNNDYIIDGGDTVTVTGELVTSGLKNDTKCRYLLLPLGAIILLFEKLLGLYLAGKLDQSLHFFTLLLEDYREDVLVSLFLTRGWQY